MASWREPWPASLLVLAVLAAYANAFGGSFQFDDFNVIVRQPAVHALGAWWDSMPGIRPLLKLSYTLSWVTGGGGTLAFHVLNVALHAANVLLVAAVLEELWRRLGVAEAGVAAFAGALLFALHPAHTEAVTYLSGRSTSMMAFFYLASVLAYLRGAPRAAYRRALALDPEFLPARLNLQELRGLLELRPAAWLKTSSSKRAA